MYTLLKPFQVRETLLAKNIHDFAVMKAEVFEVLGNVVQEYSIIIKIRHLSRIFFFF